MASRVNFSAQARANPSFITARNQQVAGATSLNVKVEGLADLRRAVKAVDKAGLVAIRETLKDASAIIARDAARLAPRNTGRLAASVRPSTSGNRAVVRSRLPYAGVIHWGGSTGRGHRPGVAWSGSVLIRPALFVSRAVDRNETAVAVHLAREFDQIIRQRGWK